MDIQLISLRVKSQQFEDKRIVANPAWNIKELKGKLSEIYPTSTEEQKLIYSGKLLNDTVVLKDVLREYEGQEAHTVHLVFTPRSGRSQSKFESQIPRQSPSSTNQITPQNTTDMSTSELRQRHTTASSTTTAPTIASVPSQEPQPQQQANVMNIPSNYMNAFYGNGTPGDANNILAQQYAMQTWMQQAYAQYMNQYMTLLSSPEAFYQMNQQQQSQQPQNFAFMTPQMPFVTPSSAVPTIVSDGSVPQSPNNEAQAAPAQVPPQQQPEAEAPQRRFPNIIQDEQENRDWLDILYSMSRLMILLCLVYFYSSPIRCLVVILIGISIYLYHIYKQNQTRLNNNNSTRVNLNNVNRQAPAPAAVREGEQPAVEGEAAPENPETNETDGASPTENEADPLIATTEPQVPLLTIVRTFVLSFFSSIIPEAPAL